MIKWLLMDVPSGYKAIIRRSTQTTVHMRTDIKYLMLLFETEDGDACIFVDKKEARSVMMITQKMTAPEAPKEQEENAIDTEEVQLIEDRTTQIAQNLPEDTKSWLVNLLMNKDLFAYSLSDMPGVDPNIAQYSLHINPNVKPIKQKNEAIPLARGHSSKRK